MNKIAVTLIVIIALVVGVGSAFLLMQTDDEPTTDQQSDTTPATAPALGEVDSNGTEAPGQVNGDYVVTITDEGFVPEILQVELGSTVVFENTSSSDAWIASDPHPSHTDLPEFDAGQGFAPGDDYSFTFEEAGEWGYHDHLRSFKTGVVVVE